MAPKDDSLARRVLKGDIRATAKLIRLVDDNDPEALPELAALYPHTGAAHVIGITGSPGVGKSTIVDKIVGKFREDGKTVGILAVDPTSPFTGGAILGDRIRMQRHFLDSGVFIRSMATRGQFGGLTRSTADAVVALDAMGKDAIIIETVGVGQDEVDIAHSAHTTVLVTIPGMGDDIQAIKAGLMEIGDLFVVNKSDREGAGKTVRELQFMLHMSSERYQESGWEPPIIQTIGVAEQGIDDLYQEILRHREYLKYLDKNELKRRERLKIKRQLFELLKEGVVNEIMKKIGGDEVLDGIVNDILDRKSDPYSANAELLKRISGSA